MDQLWVQATVLTGLGYEGVHPGIDADASVARAFEWLFWVPVVTVPSS